MRLTSTYRLQLHRGFTFADAAAQLGYLARLGISHLYLSPVLTAVPGSMHGYDVLDHTTISGDLGGRDGLEALSARAQQAGLNILVDIVPNHMAFVAPEYQNQPLWQVLRDGRDAATADWFDIDWRAGGGRLGLPVLGGTLEEALAAGELTLGVHDGAPVIRYFDHIYPVTLGTEASEGTEVAAVLDRQHYRLGSWRDNDTVLNYRRFFEVDELIAIRVELPEVFEETHRLLLDLNHAGVIDGFRVDHPDGLADPSTYLARLRAATRPGTPIWVEKILEGDEELPRSWACDGTTGYDALRAVQAALVDPADADLLQRCWVDAGGEPDMDKTVREAKRQVVDQLLGPEVERLTRRARDAAPAQDADRLREAVVELLVAGEVYRAYVRPEGRLSPQASRRLRQAFGAARISRPDLGAELDALVPLAIGAEEDEAATDFAVRLQQTWGPVMAKGVEDTVFYRSSRLVALNEVGGDPAALDRADVAQLHTWADHQARYWPLGLTALSTHDTKRSEDVRARILAVAGNPRSWEQCSSAARELAAQIGLDGPTAHLIWQTVLGAGDIGPQRLHEYLVKAVREAKAYTAWIDGDQAYEQRVLAFADRATGDGPFQAAVDQALAENAEAIRALVLAAKVVQICLPGVPDTYQGTEGGDLSLVDPDNRHPVDYPALSARLARLDDGRSPAGLGEEKLLVTATALRLRREHPQWFRAGATYQPLESGTDHAFGFVRDGSVAVLATRAPARLVASGGWTDQQVTLPEGSWTDLLGEGCQAAGQVRCAAVFADRPVALLVRR